MDVIYGLASPLLRIRALVYPLQISPTIEEYNKGKNVQPRFRKNQDVENPLNLLILNLLFETEIDLGSDSDSVTTDETRIENIEEFITDRVGETIETLKEVRDIIVISPRTTSSPEPILSPETLSPNLSPTNSWILV